jgi:hypothetical protein
VKLVKGRYLSQNDCTTEKVRGNTPFFGLLSSTRKEQKNRLKPTDMMKPTEIMNQRYLESAELVAKVDFK